MIAFFVLSLTRENRKSYVENQCGSEFWWRQTHERAEPRWRGQNGYRLDGMDDPVVLDDDWHAPACADNEYNGQSLRESSGSPKTSPVVTTWLHDGWVWELSSLRTLRCQDACRTRKGEEGPKTVSAHTRAHDKSIVITKDNLTMRTTCPKFNLIACSCSRLWFPGLFLQLQQNC